MVARGDRRPAARSRREWERAGAAGKTRRPWADGLWAVAVDGERVVAVAQAAAAVAAMEDAMSSSAGGEDRGAREPGKTWKRQFGQKSCYFFSNIYINRS